MHTNPRNGFVSSIWGPAFWLVLHCITMNYPLEPTNDDKTSYRTWFEGLRYVLPCGTCRLNFTQNLRDIHYDPVTHFQSRLSFSFLVYKLHTRVRQLQGKHTDMTFMQCLTLYEQFRALDCVSTTASGEGGCFAKKRIVCTLHIDTHDNDTCRYQIDPSCQL